MSTWIEFRCENRTEPSAEGPGLKVGDRCLPNDNAGPMAMALDTRASILGVLSELDAEARQEGWKKTREGWICPFCVSVMNSVK